MQFSSLNEWLGWLEQAHPREIDLGLERIRQVAARLDLLEPGVPVVTVAGTNGKGSCVAAVAALARAAGRLPGVYTSPHLLRYNERILVGDQPASDEQICAAFARIHAACQGVSLTYFEYGTLAALSVFREAGVDLLVLEVGLGGRLDAVNIIDPQVAVITAIDLDHQDWLGPDRESIAREKAGILRSGYPFICADADPPASLRDQAARLHAPGFYLGADFGYEQSGDTWSWWGQGRLGEPVVLGPMPLPQLPLPSLAAGLQAAMALQLVLTEAEIAQSLASVSLPGRFQVLEWQGRTLILDVAHNPAAGAYLAARLSQQSRPRRLSLVAMMADKDRHATLAALSPQVDAWYLVDLPLARAATTGQMTQDLASLGLTAAGSGDMGNCLSQALAASEPGDQLLVWGSFHTVAAALEQLTPGSAA